MIPKFTPRPIRSNLEVLNRRMFLRGVGVTMALPWLESLPAWGAESPSTIVTDGPEATLPRRFAVLFMGCGINPNEWSASGSGADMQLSKTLTPLAPLKTKINIINGLFMKSATGQGIHPAQTGNLLSGASFTKGAIIHNGITVDQVLANTMGRNTLQPSMVLACE